MLLPLPSLHSLYQLSSTRWGILLMRLQVKVGSLFCPDTALTVSTSGTVPLVSTPYIFGSCPWKTYCSCFVTHLVIGFHTFHDSAELQPYHPFSLFECRRDFWIVIFLNLLMFLVVLLSNLQNFPCFFCICIFKAAEFSKSSAFTFAIFQIRWPVPPDISKRAF